MKTKVVRTKYVIRHITDGHFLHVDGRKTMNFMEPMKWFREEDILEFLYERKHYHLENPDDYVAFPIKITYELGETGDGE